MEALITSSALHSMATSALVAPAPIALTKAITSVRASAMASKLMHGQISVRRNDRFVGVRKPLSTSRGFATATSSKPPRMPLSNVSRLVPHGLSFGAAPGQHGSLLTSITLRQFSQPSRAAHHKTWSQTEDVTLTVHHGKFGPSTKMRLDGGQSRGRAPKPFKVKMDWADFKAAFEDAQGQMSLKSPSEFFFIYWDDFRAAFEHCEEQNNAAKSPNTAPAADADMSDFVVGFWIGILLTGGGWFFAEVVNDGSFKPFCMIRKFWDPETHYAEEERKRRLKAKAVELMDDWHDQRTKLSAKLFNMKPSELVKVREQWGIPSGVQYCCRSGILKALDEAVEEVEKKANGLDDRQ